MPRKARIGEPGALHHIIVRGIERRKIFRSNYDQKIFFPRLSEFIPETRTDCFAWTLIHNHLLLRTGSVPISVLMNRLLTGLQDGSIRDTNVMVSFFKTGTNQFYARKIYKKEPHGLLG